MALFGSKSKTQKKVETAQGASVQSEKTKTTRAQRHSLKMPRITEKATAAKDTSNAYAFVVQNQATKPHVKQEIEKMYKVKVLKVNMIRVPRKAKRLGRSTGFVSAYKKAIVYLKKGDTISFA